MKSYMQYMEEITKEELLDGLLGYGMFSEKLPPVFSSKQLCSYWKNNGYKFDNRKNKEYGYIFFESMRNTNVPRQLGIPYPISYSRLCVILSNNWEKIKKVFHNNTEGDKYKISRIHIRKQFDSKSLMNNMYEEIDDNKYDAIPNVAESEKAEAIFNINYKNWKIDGDPILDFSLGKKYLVKADISQCFPSIYTHAITWALIGKENAKKRENRKGNWYNEIDNACQNMKNGETHGILIGPHSSNLISELLLTRVDKILRQKYDYIRHIDDYTCYVRTYEEAEKFIQDLTIELRKFDFSINNKKTLIKKLPQISSDFWVQELRNKPVLNKYGKVDYNTARSYLETAVCLMENNGGNVATIVYAIKVLGNNEMSKNAKEYCIKTMCNLSIIFPYLVPILNEYVFEKLNANRIEIERFSSELYNDSVSKFNFEGISYAIFFAIKYNFKLNLDINYIINDANCICKVLAFIYYKKNDDKKTIEILLEHAKSLKYESFFENWLFVYETLSVEDFNVENIDYTMDDFKMLKKAKISFLSSEYQYA